jgi:rubrerythrin
LGADGRRANEGNLEARPDSGFSATGVRVFVTQVAERTDIVKTSQVDELLYQALETEIGGVQIYNKAIECAVNDDLRKEWEKYLSETEDHVRIVGEVFSQLGLDPTVETPGREVVRFKGESLVKAMEMALSAGNAGAAQLVAAECVVEAETKDHGNWELIGHVAAEETGDRKKALTEAYEQVEEEEDEHLYHTMGWARELWLESLGLLAVLPPPEEQKKVKTAIGASRAAQAREDMM